MLLLKRKKRIPKRQRRQRNPKRRTDREFRVPVDDTSPKL